MTYDELLELLTARKALIVHCSRPGKGDEGINGLLFPEDLRNAIDICGNQHKDLSCSLIWPAHTKTFGAVGVILKPRSTASITSVSPADSGTSYDPITGKRTGGGVPFSRQAVDETFANANDYNEWTVTDADTVGIFINVREPLVVAKAVPFTEVPGYEPAMGDMGLIDGQCRIAYKEVIDAFPGLPIYAFVETELVQIGIDAAAIYH